MKKISTLLLGLLGSLLLIISSAAHAEQKQQLGEWDVHYMVVSTPFLTPEVAASYGIVRSKFNALVNISVLDAVTGTAQRVSVSGTAKNLIGTTKTLTFKKVEEGDAIYYLAVLPFRDRENYRFSIDVQRGNTMQTLNFKQEMFVDD
ncbi:DUF4426 domain-containing protein [Alteromonas stellipolaris]|uniref:DUF4426 domain-containing protein n=1 Tax=Alteromonas stellipolaris TaxID=233316 RepID=UPI0007B45B40|nr:DUF4426 domain-containing protein [Alteromonas stellipolaris]ANB21435.1 hypothetical protein A6K25_09205 [Alteromonas stellipolaris]MDO6534964.1 DUF4426 domain-containing protein [Alteromonas stellipolaris]MDO6626841.1 DUF4426 domain-containing protein [Alteromonas stellipolaris]MDP2594780.1 DUF4426 domain-containing protein [Alteromonas stellipolaris]